MGESRRYTIKLVIFLVALFYLGRLFMIQVADDTYKEDAQSNAIRKIPEHPLRGFIFDRQGKLIVTNHVVFDIKVTASELSIKDTLKLASLLRITKDDLVKRLNKAKVYPHLPYTLAKQLSVEQYASIQDHLYDYEGISIEEKTIRLYPNPVFASGLGYVKEIDKTLLESPSFNGDNYYSQGDMVGRSGIEQSYELFLRGQRGVKYVMYNAMGEKKGNYKNGMYDTLPKMGYNITTTIDVDLQKYAEILMKNKVGSIVAIEPSTGEVLTMVSAPTYDPNMLTGEGVEVTRNYLKLLQNPLKPLFNRATMAAYPPGSTVKVVQALVALQEGVADEQNTFFSCSQDIVKCHGHPSSVDLHRSIQYSCNPYYLKLYNKIIKQHKSENDLEDTRIGLEKWRKHLLSFGLGTSLESDFFGVKQGLVPSVEYYDKRYKKHSQPWRLSNIYSLSIGQGEFLAVPLQLANLAAIVANRGYYYKPHFVKQIGDSLTIDAKYKEKNFTTVDSRHYEFVIGAMSDVVRAGTARKAYIPDIEVCGKTGTSQNPHGDDHSIFIAFAPRENPKIAIAVLVENGGFGGSVAAPIASLVIEKYLNGKVKRKREEERLIALDLVTKRLEAIEAKKEREREKAKGNQPENKQKKNTTEKNTKEQNLSAQQQKANPSVLMASEQTTKPKTKTPKSSTPIPQTTTNMAAILTTTMQDSPHEEE